MNQTNTRAMVETAFISAIAVIVSALSIYLPFFDFISIVGVPAAFTIIGTKWGSKYSLIGAVVVAFLLLILFGPINAVASSLFIIVGVLIGYGNRLGWNHTKRLLIPSIAMFFSILLVLYLVALLAGGNLVNMGDTLITQVETLLQESAASNPNITQEQITSFMEMLNRFINLTKDVFFSATAVVSVFYTYCMMYVSRWLGRRVNVSMPDFLPVSSWRMPIWGAGALALGLIGLHGSSYVGLNTPWVLTVSNNLIVVGGTICAIHGFATLADILDSYRVTGKIKWTLLCAYAVVFAQALALFGIIDMFLDLRTRFNPRART